jgi:hypothetical protein
VYSFIAVRPAAAIRSGSEIHSRPPPAAVIVVQGSWPPDRAGADVVSAGFTGSSEPDFAQDELPLIIAQAPSAHMAAHGASERIMGAAPIALSQFHPSANPVATMAMPPMIRPRRPLNQGRTKS